MRRVNGGPRSPRPTIRRSANKNGGSATNRGSTDGGGCARSRCTRKIALRIGNHAMSIIGPLKILSINLKVLLCTDSIVRMLLHLKNRLEVRGARTDNTVVAVGC